MRSKNVRILLSWTIVSLVAVLNAPGQTTKPEPPTMLRIQLALSQPAPAEPFAVLPVPAMPNFAPPVTVRPAQPLEPSQPPMRPGQPVPGHPPIFTNQMPASTNHPLIYTNLVPVFTNRELVFTNRPPLIPN